MEQEESIHTEIMGKMGRREFLQRTGQVAALGGLGLVAAQSAEAKQTLERTDPHSPRTGRLLQPEETIGIGIIGVGGMGSSHLGELIAYEKNGRNVQVRAISDVYERRKQRAQARVKEALGRNIDAYTDYRKLLEREDIHGVIIATPDHWHAPNTIHALDTGKDVYCQKPVTLTIEEALAVRNKVYATGRVFQCGAQGCAEDWWWQARDFIKQGGIGKVVWAQGDYSRNSGTPENPQGGEWNYTIDQDATDNPSGGEAYIDWEQWLGPAKRRPFSKPRFFQFRKFWDYSGGIATDLLYHLLAPLTIALDAQAPERATAAGGIFVQQDDREVPDTFMVTLDYPDDYTVVLTSSMANRQGLPTVIRGHYATIRPKDGGIHVVPEDEFKEWFKKQFGQEELVIPRKTRPGHVDNWLECMRTREQCYLDAETAYRAMAGIKMAVDSYRQDRVIFWDAQREKYLKHHPRPHRNSKYPSTIS